MSVTVALRSLSQKPIHLAAAVMLLLALIPLPYGFYHLVRLVVCIASGFLAWQLFQTKRHGWMIVMGILAILFNPISPIFLTREFWMLLDLVAANLFIACPAIVTKESDGAV